MSFITRQEEIDGKWYAWIPYDGLNCLMFEDDHEINEEEAKQKLLNWESSRIVIEDITPPEEQDGTTN